MSQAARVEVSRTQKGVKAALSISLLLVLVSGCVQGQVAQIEAESDAKRALFDAEQDWMDATVQLGDVLTERALAGIELRSETKSALRIVRDAGRRARTRARAELARGEIGEQFRKAVVDLHQATRSLVGETRRLR